MNYGPLDFVGNIGVVMLMITYLMLQLNKLSSDALAYSVLECRRRKSDRRLAALRLQSLRFADGSLLGPDQLRRHLQILPA